MIDLVAALITLVELHGPEHQRFYVNPLEITSVREPAVKDLRHYAHGVRCIIVMTNGKFVPVSETCPEVITALGGAKAP